MYMAALIRPFDLSLRREMSRKCKINALIFMIYKEPVLDASYQWCLHVDVFVLEIRAPICLNRYSLVTGGVSVL